MVFFIIFTPDTPVRGSNIRVTAGVFTPAFFVGTGTDNEYRKLLKRYKIQLSAARGNYELRLPDKVILC